MKKLVLIFSLLLFAFIFVKAQVPVVNSFSPATGLVGSTVTILGSGFDGSSPANNQVFFGSAQASVLTSSFGKLTVVVPAGSTTNLISVRNVTSKLIGYSKSHFNGLFCSTPLTNTTYNTYNQQLGGIYGAYNIDIYDIDGDGKSDIITAMNGITIARNQSSIGTMNFTAYNINTSAVVQQFFVADFDGDGKRDIVISGSNGAFVFPNLSTPGTISFGARVTVNTSRAYYQCAAGDLNNDGKVDFIGGANDGSAQLYTFRNTSTGPGNFSFEANTVIPNTNINCLTRGMQSVDLDGDGKTDMAGTTWDCNSIYAIRNTTTALSTTFSFATTQSFACPGNPYRLKLGDFDKDGKIDLVTPLYSSSQTGIFRNTSTIGSISFAPLTTLPAVINNYRVGVGDVNGDGLPDIVTKPNGVGTIFQVYKNISSGVGNIAFNNPITYSSAAGAEVGGIAIGDMDGDLVPDIATSGISTNVIRFHRNTSSQPDVTPPSAICKNITVALSTSGTVAVTGAMIDNGSADACGLASLKINGLASLTYSCIDIGIHPVTLTVTDLAGNTTNCTAQVTIAPAAIIVAGQTTVCQGQTILLTANTGNSYQWQKDGADIPGASNQTYTVTVTGDYTVKVINTGCSGTSAFVHVTVNNNPTVLLTPNGSAYFCAPSNNALLTASLSSIYQWQFNGNNISGATQQTYSATNTGSYTVQVIDAFGCSASSSPVTVSGNPPEIDIRGNGNSIIDGDNTPALADHTDFGTVSPSNSVVKTYTIYNTGSNNLEISSINITGANAANFTLGGISLPISISIGSSTTFTVSFSGTTIQVYNAEVLVNNNDCDEAQYNFAVVAEILCLSPSFTICPLNIDINAANDMCSALVNYSATATHTATLSYSFSGATLGTGAGTGSGTVFNLGAANVTITATNDCGTITCSFTVTVHDNQNPVLITPVAITLECGASTLPSNTGIATATDNCTTESNIDISYTDNSTVPICGGTFTRTWSATDASNNQSTATQTITVSPAALPTMTAPEAVTISVPCGTSAVPSTLSFTNGLSGGCLTSGTSNPSTFTSVLGTCGGTLIETWTATDICGRALVPVSRAVTVSQNLGAVEPFVMFSGIGAVSNAGMSNVTGEVGSNLGAVSGFDPSTIVFNADTHTTQAKIDLLNLYIHLTNMPVTDATHAGVFGSDETLVSGVYTIPGAGSMAGNLNLDGQGNPNAVFILKTNGAFSPSAGSSITLLNGLRARNVFWIAEGAISIGTASTMKGSFISHVGAVSMGAGGDLEGRLIATVGAVSFGPGIANLAVGLSTIPVICVNSCSNTVLGSVSQFTLFTTTGAVSNTSTSGIIGNVGSNAGAVTGFGTSATTLVGNIYNADGVTSQAAADLEAGYTTLVNTTATNTAHAAVFGSGETLVAGVYEIGGAGSMAGTLTLDGGGNTAAQFIIKFGGAFSVGAQSKIILTNGTNHCNVYWLAEGAISIGASSYMKGSFISHNGANTMGANGNLEGSLLSTAGAIGFNTGVGYISYSLCTDPGYIEYARANPVFIKKQKTILIDTQISIFPNPTSGIVNFVTRDINKINSIEVVDVMGKLVYSSNHYEPTINLSNKAAGVYFIKVRLNSKITTTKIVVEK